MRYLDRVGAVAYRLSLPPELSFIHPVFHVSMLRKCISDSSQVIEAPTIPLDEKLSYEEEPMAIVDRQVRKLRSKEIVFVKVLWRNHAVEEATWEIEDNMRVKYPHLFQSTGFGFSTGGVEDEVLGETGGEVPGLSWGFVMVRNF
ncbi:PREDICTED: uncharacterized protein LOC109220164 [Nicotiana attenuata]|uniref:uncharacterized protein LOC109220164 n=1 Tax=Nicotiana attenuata TaxID=49451 RepID=UPI000905CBEE|nr:PREDICTED: uncharacterized protein LOC109220164 [Nicotiana attenuata]